MSSAKVVSLLVFPTEIIPCVQKLHMINRNKRNLSLSDVLVPVIKKQEKYFVFKYYHREIVLQYSGGWILTLRLLNFFSIAEFWVSDSYRDQYNYYLSYDFLFLSNVSARYTFFDISAFGVNNKACKWNYQAWKVLNISSITSTDKIQIHDYYYFITLIMYYSYNLIIRTIFATNIMALLQIN